MSQMTAKNEPSAFQRAMKKFLADFGLPRIIILVTFILLFVLAGVFGMNLPSFAGDVLRRWGMFGILVLAMVPAIQSGIGPNFGIPIGIVAGMVGAVLSIDMNHAGVFAFVADDGMRAFVQAMVAIVIGVAAAIPMGILYGMLLNRVKGSEMAITVYVGFGTVSLFNILWALFPVTASILILPATGRGLRQMINLNADFAGAFDQFWQFRLPIFEFGTMTVRPGLLLVFFFACFLMWLFTRSRLGMVMSAAGSNPSYARASGINVDKMRILGTTISTCLGAVGIVVYAQSFGFLQMYGAPMMHGFLVVAAVLIGGATIRRARVFDVLLGTFLFQGILVISLPLANVMLPDVAGVPEMLRLIITNGIILYALTKVKGGR
ncbi:MAG: ABC transporter permease [Clostridiales bacterium]|jgi:simple sugar transport system permease protein|nr:ABC transporter permease [Clostridiales bacterium]